MARVDHTGSAGTYRAARTLPPEILGPRRLMATVGVPNYTKLVG